MNHLCQYWFKMCLFSTSKQTPTRIHFPENANWFLREPNFIVMTLLVFFSTCDTDNMCPISNPPPSQHRCTRELQSPQLPQDSPEQQVLAIAGRPWNGNGWSWIGNGLKTIYYDLDARHRVEAGAVIIMDVNKPHLDAREKDAVGLRKSKPA